MKRGGGAGAGRGNASSHTGEGDRNASSGIASFAELRPKIKLAPALTQEVILSVINSFLFLLIKIGSAYRWNAAGPASSANPRGKKSYLSQQGTRCTSIDGPYLDPGLNPRNAREPTPSPSHSYPFVASRRSALEVDNRFSGRRGIFAGNYISYSDEREALLQTVL